MIDAPAPRWTAGVPGPASNVTSAPRAAAAAASAAPIFPDDRLPRNRTSSTGSRVGPGRHDHAPARPRSAGRQQARRRRHDLRRLDQPARRRSTRRPAPRCRGRPSRRGRRRRARAAGRGSPGSAGSPTCSRSSRAPAAAAPCDASTTAVSRSLAIPAARRAMASAVAGATTSRSASSASRMCPISASLPRSNSSRATGRARQRLHRQRGDELGRGLGHHHPHGRAGLDQQAAELGRLVGGDPPGDPQDDAPPAERAAAQARRRRPMAARPADRKSSIPLEYVTSHSYAAQCKIPAVTGPGGFPRRFDNYVLLKPLARGGMGAAPPRADRGRRGWRSSA